MNNQDQTNSIERISVASNGTQANGQSGSGGISDNGSLILFESNATNLVPNDVNGRTDIFIYDREQQSVELITIASDNSPANDSSSVGSLSGNGRYISFSSGANNLVPNDFNNQRDIFIYDRLNQTTNLVSVASDGTQANSLSLSSVVDSTGRYVAFESFADNLVPGDTNGLSDIFVRDRINQTTTRINVTSGGAQANGVSHLGGISDDGQLITFSSTASNLVPGDTNGSSDIFVYNLTTNNIQRVSVASNGAEANDSSINSVISGHGQYIAYESTASNLVTNDTNGASDIFVYDLINSTTERVSLANNELQGNGDSRNASLSDDGNIVAFLSDASNLVLGDNNGQGNIFIRDRQQQTTTKVEGDTFPLLSGDGETVAFSSSLSDLVPNDTNETGDVFALDLELNDSDLERYNTEGIHRFYQFELGSHFYTTNPEEIEIVQSFSNAGQLNYNYEGEKFIALADDKDALTGETLSDVSPVYRFFNDQTGGHFYTNSDVERDFIQTNLSNYSLEGIEYYAFDAPVAELDAVPVFRLLNADSGTHLYTNSQAELDFVTANLPNYSLENNGNPVFYVLDV
ncbi:MAG: hypothetical protein AAFQ80_02470 [Cyanobacteria bacterium J06621_8]